jgi:hypothetical protein
MKVIIENSYLKKQWKMLHGFMKGQGEFARLMHALVPMQLSGCFANI